MTRFVSAAFLAAFLAATPAVLAQEQPQAPAQPQAFQDVPPDHPAFNAVQFLAANGVVRGFSDGTYKPDLGVNRAEALKMILAPGMDGEALREATEAPAAFGDTDASVWYHPYVIHGLRRGVIDGPPGKEAFRGSDPVRLAEFLKMLELGFGVDAAGDFGDIRLPLSRDAADAEAWHYPYLRYALASAMITALADGTLQPERTLTRADAAQLVFSLIAYREGISVPTLLLIAEHEVQAVLSHLSEDNVDSARFAAARAVVASRGAIAASDDARAKGVVKIAEAFSAIVRCVTAGKEKRFSDAEAAAKEAWDLAGKARAFSAELDLAANLAQQIATTLAQDARKATAQ